MQRFGGISRYFAELQKGLQSLDSLSVDSCVKETENVHFHQIVMGQKDYQNKSLNSDTLVNKIQNKLFPLEKKLKKENEDSLKKISAGSFDIFHPTYYDPYFLPALEQKPFVLTVFDMIYEIFPEYYSSQDVVQIRNSKKKLIENAHHIITISESAKNDILSFYEIDKTKISVVYLASTFSNNYVEKESNLSLPDKYLLYVGNRDKYKNFTFFILSIAELMEKYKDLSVVVTGPPFTQSELYTFSQLGINKRIHHRFVNDEQLPMLYSKAQAFIFPSLYEGFGIPVLEAFTCGCPCVLSNTSSLPEIAGEAALYFNPKNSHELRRQVETIMQNESLCTSIIEKGYQQLKNYSWEKTTLATAEIYRNIVKQ